MLELKPKAQVNVLAILTNGPTISGLGQNPNGQLSPTGGRRQYAATYCPGSVPVRFKNVTMPFVMRQFSSLKVSGDQSSPAKQPVSGGYVMGSGDWPDAIVGGEQ